MENPIYVNVINPIDLFRRLKEFCDDRIEQDKLKGLTRAVEKLKRFEAEAKAEMKEITEET